jgi:hypothetical protein
MASEGHASGPVKGVVPTVGQLSSGVAGVIADALFKRVWRRSHLANTDRRPALRRWTGEWPGG